MTQNPRIVVFEDDEDDFIILKESLGFFPKTYQCSVEWFQEAPDLDEFTETHDPDVIIMDYRFGAINGIDIAKQIRERNKIASIIMLTGMSSDEIDTIDQDSEGILISDFLSKREVTSKVLVRSVRHAFENSRQRRELYDQKIVMEEVLKFGNMALWTEDLYHGGAVFYSDSILDLTGYTKEEFEDRKVHWQDLVLKEDRLLAKTFEGQPGGADHLLNYRIRKKNGQIIWIEENSRLITHPDNTEMMQVVGRLQDVTYRRDREESLRLMATSLDQSTESVIVTDAQLQKPGPKILYVNKATIRMTGYTAEELIGKSPRMLQGPKSDRKVLQELKECCARGEDFSATTVNYRKDGSEYYVAWKIGPIRNSAGEITHFISTQRDVTDKVLQQQELAQDQAFLKEIGYLAKVGGWRYSCSDESLYWTEQVYAIHGLDSDKKVDLEEAFAFFTPESHTIIQREFRDCVKNGTAFEEVLQLVNIRGEMLWVRMKGEPAVESGEITGVWGVYQDITELQQIRFENKVFYDMAVELACIASTEGRFTELNDKWESVLGYSKQELMSRDVVEFVHPDDRERTEKAYTKVTKEKRLDNFENRYLHKDGHIVNFLWNAVASPDGTSIFALARDISERKKRETDLEEALTKANLSNKAKNEFLMVMSHEMRTPLNPIVGFSDLLLGQIKNPDQLKYIEQIKSSALHLVDLISDILDISSIEAGRIILEKEPLTVVRAVDRVVQILRPKAESKGLKLKFLDNGFLNKNPPLFSLGDKRKVRQVIFNLVSNAIKFTRRGVVFVEFLPPAIDGGMVSYCIKVSDTGIGIDSDQLESIFERFYQIKMTASREYGGQGLGLALSRELARQMKGDVLVSSTPGIGSVFTFELRLEHFSGEVEMLPESPQGEIVEKTPTGLKVLLVEDDPVNRMVMRGLLTKLNLQFEVAEDGLQALRWTEKYKFNLILMDIQMPNMDGIEATRHIRNKDNSNHEVPIVAISAHAIDSVKKAGAEAGINDFLEKPVTLDKLNSVIASHTSKRT